MNGPFIEIPGMAKIRKSEISSIIANESGGGSPYRTVAVISMKNGVTINIQFNAGWTYDRLVKEWDYVGIENIESEALKEFRSES